MNVLWLHICFSNLLGYLNIVLTLFHLRLTQTISTVRFFFSILRVYLPILINKKRLPGTIYFPYTRVVLNEIYCARITRVIVLTVKQKIRSGHSSVLNFCSLRAVGLEWSLQAEGRQRRNWATAVAGGRNRNKPLLTRVWVSTSGKLTYRFRFETH